MTTVTVHEHVGPDAMDVLALQWCDLFAEDHLATPYQSPAWLTAWARRLPHASTPIVLAATTPTGRTLAALALTRSTNSGRTRILPLSAPHAECVRPVGPYADDPPVAMALAAHVLLRDQDVVMTDVPAASALGSFLALLGEETTCACTTTPCAAIALPVQYDNLPPSIQRKHSRRRRTWARLVHHRTITYTRTRHTQDLLKAFDALRLLQQQAWEGHDQLPGGLQTAGTDQWQAVLRDLGSTHASIASLAIDDTVIAAQLLLTRGTRCHSLIPAVDPAHRHLAPGHALLRYLIDDLTHDGFQTLDLGRSAGPQVLYKRNYAPMWSTTVSALSTSDTTAA